MRKFNLKSIAAAILMAVCLTTPVFAEEVHSGYADFDTMWAMTHPQAAVSVESGNDLYSNSNNSSYNDLSDDYTPVAGVIGEINVNGVNFRTAPSVENDAAAILSTGENVTVLSTEGEWCQVAWNGQVGYIKEERVSVCGLPLNCTQGWVTGGVSSIQANPSADGDILAMAESGTSAELLSFEDGWYEVICNGAVGYIKEDNICLDESEVSDEVVIDSETKNAAIAGADIVSIAKKYLGVRYVYGGSSSSGFDCSGFTMYVLKQLGYSLPHSATSQWNSVGEHVDRSDLQPGDLVFFCDPAISKGKACSHVGIYIGDGQIIHAASGSSSGRKVRINSLSEKYYSSYYKGAKRIIE